MDRSSRFWTPSTMAEFHRHVAFLRRLTEIPAEPRAYHERTMSQSHTHTLSTEDEIRIADCLSFLAHYIEGPKFVPTVTLLEHPDSLQVVLAGNTAPSSSVCNELTKIMAKVSHSHTLMPGGRKHPVQEELLDMVLRLSSQRVLSQLRPSWVSQPRYFRTPQLSLQARLRTCITEIQKSSRPSAQTTRLLERLEDLVEALKLVDHRVETNALLEALRMIVMSCAQFALLGSTKSVEEHLKILGIRKQLAASPEIRQVDKLARYLFTCRDLARLARKHSYRRLLSHIETTALESSQGLVRPGSGKRCFVHAEIQQIFDIKNSHIRLRYAQSDAASLHAICAICSFERMAINHPTPHMNRPHT
ncbi:hypothetical protein LZ31DRAFT_485402 [Colletotrichum somersetense]|nr:hypothetical protein LZ31DRAFT_485402 [Colletotrichum somersetense]